MKKNVIAIAALLLIAGAANAETSVNLYGLVDAGVTYVNNDGGDSNVRLDTGITNGNRWGLKGREELGNGLAGVFQVESGFALDTGASNQGGRLFGRQAFVGLQAQDIGTVTFGRQYDFMSNVGDHGVQANQMGGLYVENAFHPSNLDRTTGERVDNAVKFQSASFGGVKFGVMAGLGEKAADKAAGRAISANIGVNGMLPGLAADISYTRVNGANTPMGMNKREKNETYGVGISYDLGFGKVNTMSTFTKNDTGIVASNPVKVNTYEAGYTQRFTPQISAGLGYIYVDNKTNGMKKLDTHGVSAFADYAFTKRTDMYLSAVFAKAKKDGNMFKAPSIMGTSDSASQVAVRVGARHRF